MNVLFVHGYSETSLAAYFDFPERLKNACPCIDEIALAAFNSLDDQVTIDDLAEAMETRVGALVAAKGWRVDDMAVISHSTGALIARRWILNRVATGQTVPSHLLTLAGANHGSTLAQMGRSVLGYVQKAFLKHLMTVGANVLIDLDYGSDFLLKLNDEWLTAWNNGSLDTLFAFSAGGDSVSDDPAVQIFWQTHEVGSDNTVRICGANLNYAMISVEHNADGTLNPVARRPDRRPIPHLVLTGYSHFGRESGILGWIKPNGDDAVRAVAEALAVADAAAYQQCAENWSARLANWMGDNRATVAAGTPEGKSLIKSTALFTVRQRNGKTIDDCVIAFLDKTQVDDAQNGASNGQVSCAVAAANAVSKALMPYSPIQNNVQRGSYSFFIDYDEYLKTSPHWFHIEATSSTELVQYKALDFTQPPTLTHAISPNEFTYVTLTMSRDADSAYAVYDYPLTPEILAASWMPFPDGQIGQLRAQ